MDIPLKELWVQFQGLESFSINKGFCRTKIHGIAEPLSKAALELAKQASAQNYNQIFTGPS